MNEMVERVARAAFERWDFAGGPFDELPDDAKDHWRAVARAAIEAMREPTVAMMKAGGNMVGWHAYEAMIAAALPDEAGGAYERDG